MTSRGVTASKRPTLAIAGVAFALTLQAFLGAVGVADDFTRGHNGYNSSAYLLAARNSLRFHRVLAHQYHTGPDAPPPSGAYTHHPPLIHWTNVASVWLFGDHPASVRGVAALHGLFAAAALAFVVSRLWSWSHAAVATAVYVLLPINAIYLNMTNHNSGFLGWGLLTLYAYIRQREDPSRWRFAAFLGAFAWAAAWDWPAYYLAFAIACHWALANVLGTRDHGLPLFRGVGRFTLFCAWVLFQLVWLALVMVWATGGVDDILATFSARQGADAGRFLRNVRIVPAMMFTWPVLFVAGVWCVRWFARVRQGAASVRDLIPFTFCVGGLTHYVVFKSSSVVHEFWLWTTLPFVAIAMAEWVVGLSRARERQRGRVVGLLVTAGAILLAVVPLSSLVHRTVTMVPSARWVGGSMWFISDVRAERPSAFESGRDEIRFARAVHRSTDRRTVVYVDGALAKRETETRFETTLDRTTISATWRSARTSVPPRGHDGAVAIGVRSAITDADTIALARANPFTVWDDYYMVDYRREVEDVQIYRSAAVPPTWRWRFFHSPFEFDTRWERDRDAERALRDAIAIRPVAPRAQPGSLGLPPAAVRALIR